MCEGGIYPNRNQGEKLYTQNHLYQYVLRIPPLIHTCIFDAHANPNVHAAMRIKSVKSHVHTQELNLSLVMDIGNAQTHMWES